MSESIRAYLEGQESYKQNGANKNGAVFFRKLGLNPFEIGSCDYWDWEKGFIDALERQEGLSNG